MVASGRAIRPGRKARMRLKGPVKFTAMTRSMSLSSRSLTRTNGWMIPATLISPSTGPNALSTFLGSALTLRRLLISIVNREKRALFAPASDAVSSSHSGLISKPATEAPRFSSPRATSRPMPFPAPVTTKTLPECPRLPLQRSDRLQFRQGASGTKSRAVRVTTRSGPGVCATTFRAR